MNVSHRLTPYKAWKEIEDTECYKDYGMPRKDF